MSDHDSTAVSEAAPHAGLAPGAVLGSYELVRALGSGSYGTVYEALRRPLGKRVALKVLHRAHVAQVGLVARFLREASVVASLQHPHIIDVFDVGLHEGVPFLAMEFLDGETLGQRLARDGQLPSAEAVDLLLGVVSAVAAAHARGVIHRDLKPDNIFLTRLPAGADFARLLDFGIAKVSSAEVGLTSSRALLGTPRYMSPEQIEDARELTGASDQWALAVILYECVTGALPFQETNLLSLLNAVVRDTPVPARVREASVPEGLSAVIARAMEKDPEARFPSVSGLAEALGPYASPRTRGTPSPIEHHAPTGSAQSAGLVSAFPLTGNGPRPSPWGFASWGRVGALLVGIGLFMVVAMRLSAGPVPVAVAVAIPARDAAPVTSPALVTRVISAGDVPPLAVVVEDVPQRYDATPVDAPRAATPRRVSRRLPDAATPTRPIVAPDCPNGICPVD